MDRIVDIATDGRHLSLHRGFLVVSQDREDESRSMMSMPCCSMPMAPPGAPT
jgi:hypothetical protein